MFDCIIIGAGPAGMTAALYLARKKMKILLITSEFGGQTAKAASVENYLGFEKISGIELIGKFQTHLDTCGVESKIAEVEEIRKKNDNFEVRAGQENFETKSVIVASGKCHRHLNVPGEKELTGKGVSYCATCDGPIFRDKTVAVIGGGNSALDAALELEKYTVKVYIINLNENLQGDEIRQDQLKKSAKVEIINNSETMEVLGVGLVSGLKYKDLKSNQEKEIKVEGIFIEIGWVPSTAIVKDLLELNNLGEIKINNLNETSSAGIFAAGDITDVPNKQIIIAAGEGAKAALSAWKYIITHR